MLYLSLKAFHLMAVLTWIGGMLALSVSLAAMSRQAPITHAVAQPLLVAIHRWDRRITTPALGVVWLLGITLVVMGGWYAAAWLWAKFVLVFVLSGLHGKQSATLRRMLTGQTQQPADSARLAPWFTLAAVAAIAWLVILKPWGSF